MLRGAVIRWGLALMGLAILVGCKSPDDGKVHLRYMAWGNVEQLALEQQLVDSFNRQNPDLHVELFKVPQSAYKNKMILMFASRTSPDVGRVDHYDFPQLAERNYFHELDEFIQGDLEFKLSDFFPAAVEECKVNGKMQGLNVLFGGGIMFYNKKLLNEAGLDDPFELYKKGEWTYAKMREYAIKTTKYDKSGRAQQFGVNMATMPFYFATIQAFGGRFLNETLDKCLLDSPEAIEAMQFLSDLRWKDKCCPTPAQGANSAFAFETGKLALEFNYVGASARYRQMITKFEWDICPLPDGPKGNSLFVKGNQLIMYKETQHPKEAWRLMKFLTGPEAEQVLYVRERRQSPSRIALAFSDAYLHPKTPPFNMESVSMTVKEGTKLPIGPRWPEVMQVAGSELDNLFAGREKNAAESMKSTTAAVNKLLGEEPGF